MNEQITQALSAIEQAGAAPSGELLDTYQGIRPHLRQLVEGLSAQGGDFARLATVLENLLAGADSVASGAPATSSTSPSTSDAAKI